MSEPTITTKCGKIQGYEEDGLNIFKGIPYAAPPVGANRWLPPQPLEPWSGVRETKRYSAIAPQSEAGLRLTGVFDMPPQSEDCLYLNVWTPGLDDGKRMVLLWIHGGGFSMGSSWQALYDGRLLAIRGNAVIVTINYRLGPLGFMNLKEVTDGRIPATGNEGLLDQIAALHWVKDNIASFGGDADNITIFGESAGGMSCGCLLAMPGARGLFHRAILQSGAASTVQSVDTARQTAERFLHIAQLEGRDVAELRALTARQAVEIQEKFGLATSVPFSPVVDGRVLPSLPLEAVNNGASDSIPLLIGSTLDEWALWTQEGFDPGIRVLNQEQVIARLSRVLEHAPGLIETYRKNREKRGLSTEPGDIFTAVQTDRTFRIPAIRLAEAKQKHRQPAYHYIFTWPSSILRRLGACHATDIGFVWGTYNVNPRVPKRPEADIMVKNTQEAWLAFSRTGNPSCASLGEWPPYGVNRETMMLGEKCYVTNDPYGEERQIWQSVPDEEVGNPRSFPPNLPIEYIEYVDPDGRFAFSYNNYWAKNERAMVAPVVAWFSSPDWNCPGVIVTRLRAPNAPTLKALLPEIFGASSNPVVSTDEKVTNIYGIAADGHVLEYTAPNGIRGCAKVYGFKSGDFWWVMRIYQAPTLGTLDSVGPDRIFSTWKVTE